MLFPKNSRMAHFNSVCNTHTIWLTRDGEMFVKLENIKQNSKFVISTVALLALTSCHKQPVRTEEPVAEKRSSAEIIQDADRLYTKRSNLQKVREALVALRHAQLSDGGNYEVAWRLAKYNYYVGAH